MSSPGQNIRYVASNTGVNDCTRYIRSRVPILCQMNGSQALPSYFFTPRFNTVLTSTQISFKLCISFRFPPPETPYTCLFSPHPSGCHTHCTLHPWFWHSEDRALWYILIMNAKAMHYFSNLFDKVLYMFRTRPLSIIRSISTLYTRNRCLSF